MVPKKPVERPRTLLLATDMAARSDRAFDRAIWLAKEWGARLVVVHALEASVFPAHPSPSWRRPTDPAQAAERRLRQELLHSGAPGATLIVSRGDPAEIVLKTASAHNADLIVLSGRGEVAGRFLLGATAEHVLRRTTIPLLIVKSRPLDSYRNAVAATDFSESSRHALRAAMALFPETPIAGFHAHEGVGEPIVAPNPDAYEAQWREAAAKEWGALVESLELPEARRAALNIVIEYGRPAPLLREYVQEKEVDLVVLGTRGRNALLDILIGSVAKQILAEVPSDALLVREPRGN